MDNSINFKGAFIVKFPNAETKSALKEILGKKTYWYEKFSPKGDLFVTKNGNDLNAGEFIYNNKLKCEYYPEMDKTSGFIKDSAESAKQVLKSTKTKVVCGISQLNEHFNGVFKRKSKQTSVDDIKTAVKLSDESVKPKLHNNGVISFINKDRKMIAKSSPKSQAGLNFVYVSSKNTDESPRLLVIKGSQEVNSVKPENITRFMKMFNDAIEFHNK